MNDINQVLAKVAITFLYNDFLERFEPPFVFEVADSELWWREHAQQMRWSADNRAHFIPSDLDRDHLLVAFERMTRHEPREYMLLAIGEQQDENLLSAAVERGRSSCVGWPRAGLRELGARIKRGQGSRIVVVHNHPYGFLHALIEAIDIRAFGPSSGDRDEMLRVAVESIRTRLIIPEFYVVENGEFRRIIAPSWERLVEMVKWASQVLGK